MTDKCPICKGSGEIIIGYHDYDIAEYGKCFQCNGSGQGLDVTLTLAEYIRRMNSADASEWLPTPAETVVIYQSYNKRVKEIRQDDKFGTLIIFWRGGVHAKTEGWRRLIVSRIPY